MNSGEPSQMSVNKNKLKSNPSSGLQSAQTSTNKMSTIGTSITSFLASSRTSINSLSFNGTIHQLKDNIKNRQTLMQSYESMRADRFVLKTTGWASLPRNVLENIFQYVDHHQVVIYCTLVCKYWRRAIMTKRFITSLSIAHNEAPLSFVYNFLREFNTLKYLTLDNVPELEPILMQAHKVCVNLKHISLVNYTYIGYNVIVYILKNFPNIEGLNFDSSYVVCNNLSTDITMFNNLKSLNLFNTKAMGMVTQAILEIVLNCRQLEELNIGLCPPMVNLEDEDVMLILTNLAPKLKSLTLDSRKLTMRSLEKLKSCKLLTKLYIKYAVNMTGDFLVDFARNLHSVKELGFTHNCIVTGYDISGLFMNGPNVFTDLVLLDLTYCLKLDDIGIEAIAEVCTKLHKILLKSCRSITSIVPIFVECKELRYADVSYCIGLVMNFIIPSQLEVLIVDERKKILFHIEKYKFMKYLKIYASTSEYNDNLILI